MTGVDQLSRVMRVHEVLRQAITTKQCVRLRLAGRPRDICPHALGLKNGHPRLLAFQYDGASDSGIAAGGAWRTFFVSEISDAKIIAGAWHSGPNLIAKAEACLDRIEYLAHH
jgi:predicted DNA-binding transcriptional regulator YafY